MKTSDQKEKQIRGVRISNSSSRSRSVALILCILFGLLGLHRFYVGKNFSGFLFICTFGYLGLGPVVDFVVILIGRFTDDMNRKVDVWSITPNVKATYQRVEINKKEDVNSSSKLICNYCNSLNEKDTNFCINCGNPI